MRAHAPFAHRHKKNVVLCSPQTAHSTPRQTDRCLLAQAVYLRGTIPQRRAAPAETKGVTAPRPQALSPATRAPKKPNRTIATCVFPPSLPARTCYRNIGFPTHLGTHWRGGDDCCITNAVHGSEKAVALTPDRRYQSAPSEGVLSRLRETDRSWRDGHTPHAWPWPLPPRGAPDGCVY